MFKLLVLSVVITVAVARPGYLSSHGPSVILSAPATIVHEPAYAKIGAIVKSIPTAVSHQSSSVVHSAAQVIQPILAPVVKTIYTAPVLHAAPAPLAHSGGWAPSW